MKEQLQRVQFNLIENKINKYSDLAVRVLQFR